MASGSETTTSRTASRPARAISQRAERLALPEETRRAMNGVVIMAPSMLSDMKACMGPSAPPWSAAKRGRIAGASRVAGSICRNTAAISQWSEACFASISESSAGRGSFTRRIFSRSYEQQVGPQHAALGAAAALRAR